MKPTHERSESLKKALDGSKTFDEARYYQSQQVEMGGDDVLEEVNKPTEEDEDDDDEEDHEFYGDD